MRTARWWLALLLVAPGCASLPYGVRRTSLAEVRDARLLQVSDEYVLLEHAGDGGATYELLDRKRSAWRPLRLPGLAGCARTTYGLGFARSRYELGLRRECHRPDGPRDLDLIAYNMRNGKVRVVLASPPPDADGYVRFSDDLLAWFSDAGCTWLKRYRPGTGEPRPLEIRLAEDGWPLDAVPPVPGECRDHGVVMLPAGAAGGGLGLAFAASPAARGRTGDDRMKAKFGLYRFHMDGSDRIADLPGRPRAASWTGNLAVSLDSGVYVFGRYGLRRLTDDVASSVVTSHRSVYYVKDTDGADPVYRIDLPIVD